MKIILLVSVLLLVSAGGIFFFAQPSEAPTNVPNGVVPEVTTPAEKTMTPEEQAKMTAIETAPETTNETTPDPATMIAKDTVDDSTMHSPEMRMINITGANFSFNPKEIRVKEGDTVMVHFTSADGYHDWVLDEFNVRSKKVRPADGMTMVSFVASKKGTFEYYCSIGSHRANGMVGKLIVE